MVLPSVFYCAMCFSLYAQINKRNQLRDREYLPYALIGIFSSDNWWKQILGDSQLNDKMGWSRLNGMNFWMENYGKFSKNDNWHYWNSNTLTRGSHSRIQVQNAWLSSIVFIQSFHFLSRCNVWFIFW